MACSAFPERHWVHGLTLGAWVGVFAARCRYGKKQEDGGEDVPAEGHGKGG